jgi:hypothetical protein
MVFLLSSFFLSSYVSSKVVFIASLSLGIIYSAPRLVHQLKSVEEGHVNGWAAKSSGWPATLFSILHPMVRGLR